ncbi:hypothetical protein AJ80_07114 [Polytolypa hystricis UAMH7299]|uniref:Uncharacterized protein n=1 Tax=Polytolypa hystricis (strain UAMH7299) TaxID=1447883 RepID=A0A2B7XR71_POLH7|nr:hypothetical protein AJ80_07114 [Polytolypa hystricis UAMH7299]
MRERKGSKAASSSAPVSCRQLGDVPLEHGLEARSQPRLRCPSRYRRTANRKSKVSGSGTRLVGGVNTGMELSGTLDRWRGDPCNGLRTKECDYDQNSRGVCKRTSRNSWVKKKLPGVAASANPPQSTPRPTRDLQNRVGDSSWVAG